MRYKASSEGASALRKMANSLEEAKEQILHDIVTVTTQAVEHVNVLGPHVASLEEALTSISQSVDKSSKSVELVSKKLEETAAAYEEFEGDDRIKSKSLS